MNKKRTIRLASSSETRALLLEKAGIPFIQSPVEFDDMPLKLSRGDDFNG